MKIVEVKKQKAETVSSIVLRWAGAILGSSTLYNETYK
mgnify:FL=1